MKSKYLKRRKVMSPALRENLQVQNFSERSLRFKHRLDPVY